MGYMTEAPFWLLLQSMKLSTAIRNVCVALKLNWWHKHQIESTVTFYCEAVNWLFETDTGATYSKEQKLIWVVSLRHGMSSLQCAPKRFEVRCSDATKHMMSMGTQCHYFLNGCRNLSAIVCVRLWARGKQPQCIIFAQFNTAIHITILQQGFGNTERLITKPKRISKVEMLDVDVVALSTLIIASLH